MFKKALFVLATSTLIAGSANAANLLTNGSFEDGFEGWTLTNNEAPGQGASAPIVIKTNSTASYPNGAFGGEKIPTDNAATNPNFDNADNHVVYFSSDTSTAPAYFQSLSQSVTLEAGKSYTFGFDIYKTFNGNANPNEATFIASLAGTEFANFTADSLNVGEWTHIFGAQTFTADTSGEFTFTFNSNGYTAKDFAIDRVYLAATDSIPAVPEPATWGLMIVGFGLIGAAIRRRGVRTSVRFA